MDITQQLLERKNHLIKSRDQLIVNLHIMDGAIHELERLIKFLNEDEGEKKCAVQENPPEEKRKVEKKVVENQEAKNNSGGAKENRTPVTELTTQCLNH